MDKKKIETFGSFCELIANEPENVYLDDAIKSIDSTYYENDSIEYLFRLFTEKGLYPYYHIPAKKKKTKAQFYSRVSNLVYVFYDDYKKDSEYIKIPNTEFVDEKGEYNGKNNSK